MHSKASISLVGMTLVGALLVPSPTNAVSAPAMPSDFNGDGYADLAIGVPGDKVSGHWGAGAVNVLYGSASGLTADGDQLWSQDSPGVKGVSQGRLMGPYDQFGHSVASGDFDRDGFADLAIGVPNDKVGAAAVRAGSVNVLYGSPAGLTASGDQLWSQANLPGTPERLDRFGSQLVTGDFDADGYWDLVIAVPGDGLVLVLNGSSGGLAASGTTTLTGLAALAAGDLDGDASADLVVGGYDPVGGSFVGVVSGGPAGLAGTLSQAWYEDDPGLLYERWPGDAFGSAVAVGDFDQDGHGDLAIGIPNGEVEDSNGRAGKVLVLYGTSGGPTTDVQQAWHELWPSSPDEYFGDCFGCTLAAGDLDGDGADDLVMGAEKEGYKEGAIMVLYGSSPDGLSDTGWQFWWQDSPGVPGASGAEDNFAYSLAIADWGRSGAEDLAIGVPGEGAGGTDYAGRVIVMYGNAGGLSTAGIQSWGQNTAGVKGVVGFDDNFGWSVTP